MLQRTYTIHTIYIHTKCIKAHKHIHIHTTTHTSVTLLKLLQSLNILIRYQTGSGFRSRPTESKLIRIFSLLLFSLVVVKPAVIVSSAFQFVSNLTTIKHYYSLVDFFLFLLRTSKITPRLINVDRFTSPIRR